MPRVSVLMPARDAAATVRGAVRSILWQSHRDLELVVVDDGSGDATPELLARLSAADPRVKVVRSPARGVAAALNLGLARCDAEVVARMDADDLAHPRRLALQLEALAADPRLWAVGSQVRAFPRGAVRDGMRRYVAWVNGLVTPALVARDLLVESPLVHPAATVRRAALERLGGWREGPFPEDYDLWLRASEAGAALTNLPAPLLLWRERKGRVTRTDPRCGQDRHLALKCAHLRRVVLAGRREVAVWGAGETGRALARALRAEQIAVALFLEVDRKKVGRTALGAPIFPYEEGWRARGLPLLVAVGAPGARPAIRAELVRQGFEELSDYWCVS